MQISLKSIGTVISIWLGLMILLSVHHVFFGRHETTRFIYSGYMLIVPFLLTRLAEKRSIVERFGFQTNNVLGLAVVSCFGLITGYYLGSEYITSIVLAPIVEELFFRGYMLGALSKPECNKWEWKLNDLAWIFFTSIVFALSHIFKYYSTIQSTMYLFMLAIYSLSFGFLYIRFRTILWCFLLHMLYNLSIPLGFTEIVSYLLTAFSIIIVFTYILKSMKKTLKLSKTMNST